MPATPVIAIADERAVDPPSLERSAAESLHRDRVWQRVDGLDNKIDELLSDARAVGHKLEVLEGHARSHGDALRLLFENLGQVALDAEKSKLEILAAVEAVDRKRRGDGRASRPDPADAQALQQQIESSYRDLFGTTEVMKKEIDGLKKAVGSEANENLGLKGHGLLGSTQTFSRRRELVLYGLGGSSLVGTLAAVAALVKLFLLH